MSIRSLARELYRAQQKVTELQNSLASAAAADRDSLAREMRLAQEELRVLRRMLDGEKESGSFRQRFSGFGSTKK